MISQGVWTDVDYINCDDYNGQNQPARKNFNLRKYFDMVICSHIQI